VTFVMGRHIGNNVTYTVHILTPLLVYSLMRLKGDEFKRLSAITILVIIAGGWSFMPSVSFGMINKNNLITNESTLKRVSTIIAKLNDKKLYVSPYFAFLAYEYGLDYIDSGNREYIAIWEKRKNVLDKNILFRMINLNSVVIKERTFVDYFKTANYVLCTIHCPRRIDGFVDTRLRIGEITNAYGQHSNVRLFRRKTSEVAH